MNKIIIISFGGSLLFKNNCLNKKNILNLVKFVTILLKRKNKIIIVVGGGAIARKYQSILRKNKDLIGIEVTKLNALLLKLFFEENKSKLMRIYPDIIFPSKINKYYNLFFSGGYEPGMTTDSDAVLFAIKNKTNLIINLTNVDFIYDYNSIGKINKRKPFKQLTLKQYLKKIKKIHLQYKSGMHIPFDPIAARKAMKYKIIIYSINGNKLDKMKGFVGTRLY